MILLTIRMTVQSRDRDAVLNVIRPMLGPTSVEAGCAGCHVNADIDDRNVLFFSEEWDTQSSLERHVRSVRFRNLLSVLDLATEPPDIRIHTITETRGLEVIRAARLEQA
jgi:quinol monooxygenase YgiN